MKSKKIALALTLSLSLSMFSSFIANAAPTYVVKKGDILKKIAREYNVSVKEIAEYNNIKNPNMIYIGQTIKIPKGAKNVILLIGDGMGFGQLELGRIMQYGKDGKLHMESMSNTAFVKTNPFDGYVTDSAAAGTAIATGKKTTNGAIGTLPDGTPAESMTKMFKEMGKKIGIISTNTVYDATPGAFGANASNRGDSAEIVRDLYDEQWDILLGGGAKYFGAKKQDGVDYIGKFKESGYTYIENQEQLLNVKDTEKLLGLFNNDYMSYKADRDELNSKEPSLKEMTAKALDILSKDEDGFFLMSEGARIDHAAHAGDATGVWQELVEFDETVKYALDWAKEHKDTIVIVVADHETMAMAPSETINIEGLKAVKASPEYMAMQLEKNAEETMFTTESIKNVFSEYASMELTDEQVLELQGILKVDMYSYKLGWEIGSVIAKHYGVTAMDPSLRAVSKTGGHTSTWIPLFAEGEGTEKFRGVLDNTNIIDIIMEIAK